MILNERHKLVFWLQDLPSTNEWYCRQFSTWDFHKTDHKYTTMENSVVKQHAEIEVPIFLNRHQR